MTTVAEAVRAQAAAWIRRHMRERGTSTGEIIELLALSPDWFVRLESPREGDDVDLVEFRDVIVALGGSPQSVFGQLMTILRSIAEPDGSDAREEER